MAKKILVVVDFQNDFVDGSLGFAGALLLDEKISAKIRSYRDEGEKVVFTLDTHEDNYLTSLEGRNLPVPHCVRGTNGHAIYGRTGLLAKDEMKFEKGTFGSIKLLEYLAANDFSSVELVGLVSNICVLSNAVLAKTALPEARIVVDASCTDSFDPDLHRKALDILAGLQAEVINR